jgi:hypothetical protein
MKASFVPAVVVAAAVSLSTAAHALSNNELDTFSAGIEGWFAGAGPFGQVPSPPPSVVATGGPAGAGDSFMLVTANGSDAAGGRLVAMNAAQWAGNYPDEGISSIAMDLRNLGTSDLTIRLYLEDPIPGPPLNEAVTNFSVFLPAGGAWTHAVFPIAPSDLTVLQGSAATLLSNTTVLRIFNGIAPDFPPERVSGLLGVDNIQAIPEPETFLLMAGGLLLVAARALRWGARSR